MEDYTYINDKPLNLFCGFLLADYEVGQAVFTFDKTDNRFGSGFVVTNRKIALRNISLTIHTFGETPEDAQEKLSLLMEEFVRGKVKLVLPDGFIYFAVLTSQNGPKMITEEMLETTLSFQGVRCRPKITAKGNNFFVRGTLPETECVITAVVGETALTYKVGDITFDGGDAFSQMVKGDVIVINGINKTVTVNGEPAVDRCDMISFPTVHPGENVITAPDPVTLEYYPSYI